MSLQLNGVKTNKNFREINPHGTPEFPCTGYEIINKIVEWHWHNEFEFVYIPKGKYEFKTSIHTCILKTEI